MFIQLGLRRINMSLVKSYGPKDKNTITGQNYQIELTYLNDTTKEIHFFKEKKKRDEYLELLDNQFLLTKL